jgi:hypothetical protein
MKLKPPAGINILPSYRVRRQVDVGRDDVVRLRT